MKRHGYVANAEVKTGSLVGVAAEEGQRIFFAFFYTDTRAGCLEPRPPRRHDLVYQRFLDINN
jgi:hypothetical protein